MSHPIRPRRAAFVFSAAVACALAACPAVARAEGPSRGVLFPFTSPSLADEASGMAVNPGAVGRLRGWEASIFVTSLSNESPGGGQALFLATPTIGPLSIGLGFEHVDLQLRGGVRFEDYVRFSFGPSVALTDTLSFGFNFRKFFGSSNGIGDLFTLDMGALWRPLSWLSLGAVAQDVWGPSLAGVPIHRSWALGAAVRPGTDKLMLGVDVTIEEVSRRVDPTFRLAFTPTPGLTVGGMAQLRDRDGRTEATGMAYLSWGFDLGGPVRGSVTYGSVLERGRGFDGHTFQGRIHGYSTGSPIAPSGRYAKIHLTGAIPEQGYDDRIWGSNPAWTTARALAQLDAAIRDPRIAGVVLAFDGISLGLAQAEEIRVKIGQVRAAKKKVVSHVLATGEGHENATYFAASGSDQIFLHPSTSVNVVGFSASVLFLRGLLDKIGVLPEFIAEGKYKSFAEQFTRKEMSEPAREATRAYLSDASASLVGAIAAGRGKTPEAVRALLDRGPFSPEDAVREGLADGISYLDELPEKLATGGKKIEYLARYGGRTTTHWGQMPSIAVVHIEGTISEGKSFVDPIFGRRHVGAETVIAALRDAREDSSIKAVVLRVDSPGGMVTASDRIWHEVMRTRAKKPVVASFGNVAASGGYYVASAAHEIFADPSSLTGSIGVIFGKVSFGDMLGKLDVSRETVALQRRADLFSAARPWTAEERVTLRRLVKSTYEQFLSRITTGRKMTRDEVHAAGQGRIWSGTAAKERKLVDHLGGLEAAVRRAKVLAGMEPDAVARVQQLPEPGFLAKLMQEMREVGGVQGSTAAALGAAFGAFSSPLLYLKAGQPWVIMPYEITVR